MNEEAIDLLCKVQCSNLCDESFLSRLGWYIRWRVIERLSGRDPDASPPNDEGDWKPLFWGLA